MRASTTVWLEFAADTIHRLVAGLPIADLIPVRQVASAAVAGYLGLEMLVLQRHFVTGRELGFWT